MSKEFSPYEFGDIAQKERLDRWKLKQDEMHLTMVDGGQAEVVGKIQMTSDKMGMPT